MLKTLNHSISPTRDIHHGHCTPIYIHNTHKDHNNINISHQNQYLTLNDQQQTHDLKILIMNNRKIKMVDLKL